MLLLHHCNYTVAGRNNAMRWMARVVTFTSPSTSLIDFSGLSVLSPLLIRQLFSSALYKRDWWNLSSRESTCRVDININSVSRIRLMPVNYCKKSESGRFEGMRNVLPVFFNCHGNLHFTWIYIHFAMSRTTVIHSVLLWLRFIVWLGMDGRTKQDAAAMSMTVMMMTGDSPLSRAYQDTWTSAFKSASAVI